jgi:hypothetical protein
VTAPSPRADPPATTLEYVAKVVAAAPALSDEKRNRLAELLRPPEAVQHETGRPPSSLKSKPAANAARTG